MEQFPTIKTPVCRESYSSALNLNAGRTTQLIMAVVLVLNRVRADTTEHIHDVEEKLLLVDVTAIWEGAVFVGLLIVVKI